VGLIGCEGLSPSLTKYWQMNINFVQANHGSGESGGGEVEEIPQGLNRLRKKTRTWLEWRKSTPQGLKPALNLCALCRG
jgi:hypothetical protein